MLGLGFLSQSSQGSVYSVCYSIQLLIHVLEDSTLRTARFFSNEHLCLTALV